MDKAAVDKAIQAWNDLWKNAPKNEADRAILENCLFHGNYFDIDCSDFTNWNKSATSLHVYFSLTEEKSLEILLIDNISDREKKYDAIVKKTLADGVITKMPNHFKAMRISALIATKRINRWIDKRERWFDAMMHKKKDNRLLAIQVPFEDYVLIYNNPDAISSNVLALEKEELVENSIEIIVLSNNKDKKSLGPPNDLSRPIPPFKEIVISDYQILLGANVVE